MSRRSRSFLWKKRGKEVQRRNETIFDKEYKYFACNIDRKVVGEDAILECKTASAWKGKEWGGDDIPQEYILQCMWNLMVTGQKKCYIAVLIGNSDFKWKEILRDEDIIKDMRSRAVEFWTYVVNKQMPPFISYLDNEPLSAMFSTPTNEVIRPVDNTFNEKFEQLSALDDIADDTKKKIDTIKNELKAVIGTDKGIMTDKYQATWSLVKKKEHMVKASEYRELRKKSLGGE